MLEGLLEYKYFRISLLLCNKIGQIIRFRAEDGDGSGMTGVQAMHLPSEKIRLRVESPKNKKKKDFITDYNRGTCNLQNLCV